VTLLSPGPRSIHVQPLIKRVAVDFARLYSIARSPTMPPATERDAVLYPLDTIGSGRKAVQQAPEDTSRISRLKLHNVPIGIPKTPMPQDTAYNKSQSSTYP
jgi:hypothetical protein